MGNHETVNNGGVVLQQCCMYKVQTLLKVIAEIVFIETISGVAIKTSFRLESIAYSARLFEECTTHKCHLTICQLRQLPKELFQVFQDDRCMVFRRCSKVFGLSKK